MHSVLPHRMHKYNNTHGRARQFRMQPTARSETEEIEEFGRCMCAGIGPDRNPSTLSYSPSSYARAVAPPLCLNKYAILKNTPTGRRRVERWGEVDGHTRTRTHTDTYTPLNALAFFPRHIKSTHNFVL